MSVLIEELQGAKSTTVGECKLATKNCPDEEAVTKRYCEVLAIKVSRDVSLRLSLLSRFLQLIKLLAHIYPSGACSISLPVT